MNSINDNNYKQILSENKAVLVDFSAAWCGPCNSLAPTIEKLSDEYKDKVYICTCNIDECPEFVSISGIRNIPTLFFYKNGEFYTRLVGLSKEDVIKECIEELLKDLKKLQDTETL